jgi:acyl-CoA reductase-like NAD-dependent aldehyde dehydrogenase
LIHKVKKLKVNAGHEPGTDIGPVISKESKARIENIIEKSEKEGAKILLGILSLLLKTHQQNIEFNGIIPYFRQ